MNTRTFKFVYKVSGTIIELPTRDFLSQFDFTDDGIEQIMNLMCGEKITLMVGNDSATVERTR